MGPAAPDQGAPVDRPGLEYQHALDLCALEAHRAGEPVTVYASSRLYAGELSRRLDPCGGVLVPCGEWEPTRAVCDWSTGQEAGSGGFRIVSEASGLVAGKAAVWAEPEVEDLERTSALVGENVVPGARLCVVTSGWLRRGLPEWRGKVHPPARRPAGLRRTLDRLRQASFTIDEVYGFHGPRSLAWGFASRVPAALGREDLLDRCLAAMRKGYVVSGWQAHWAPVAVVLARRVGISTGFRGSSGQGGRR